MKKVSNPYKDEIPPRPDFPKDRDHDANRRNKQGLDTSNYGEKAYSKDQHKGRESAQTADASHPGGTSLPTQAQKKSLRNSL